MIKDGSANNPTVPEKLVPAPLLQKHMKDPFRSSWPMGGTPGGGDSILPHIFTVAGRYGVASKVYSTGDEALMDSRENAELMRNELAIMECLEARKRSTSLLSWHIGPADEGLDARTRDKLKILGSGVTNNWDAEELAAKVSLILMRTPNLVKLFDSLMDAIWYGRYGTEQFWKADTVTGISNRCMVIKKWQPRHGDKWVFRYDDGSMEYDPDQIGIRIGPGYNVQKQFEDYGGNRHNKVEATMYGLAYFLDGAERKRVAMHKHMIEDGDYNHPIKAGHLHGLGIRSRIYWTWYAYSECLKLLLEYLERSALGIEIWRFPAHNPKAKDEAMKAAQNRGAPGRSILMVPMPEGEQAPLFGVEHIEPGFAGADMLQSVLDRFFGHKIKRYILGQTLTTEADATGLGSGVADAHQATYADIVRFDSLGLAETITQDIVRQIQLLNFPGSEGIYLKFSFDTESPQMQYKLDAYRQAWEMGGKIKADDVYRTIGASRPNEGDDILQNPAFMQQMMDPMMMGMDPAMMGQPGMEADPAMAQEMLEPVESGQYRAGDDALRGLGFYPAEQPLISERLPAITRYAAKTNPNPSKAQRMAGNYAKRRVNWNGLRISIENEAGSKRHGWDHELTAPYGYIKGTKAHDDEQLDVYLGPFIDSDIVFIIDQEKRSGKIDEWKVVIGCNNKKSAVELYVNQYPKGWKAGKVTSLTVEQFKKFLKEKHGKKIRGYASRTNFSATEEPGATRQELLAGIRNLADHETAMSQPQESEVSALRGQGDNGQETNQKTPARTDEQRRELHAEQLLMGDPDSTGQQSTQQYTNRVSGPNTDAGRMVPRAGLQLQNGVHQDSNIRLGPNQSDYDSQGGRKATPDKMRGIWEVSEQIDYATQGTFWNEEDHPRETTSHMGKDNRPRRPGEFAPKPFPEDESDWPSTRQLNAWAGNHLDSVPKGIQYLVNDLYQIASVKDDMAYKEIRGSSKIRNTWGWMKENGAEEVRSGLQMKGPWGSFILTPPSRKTGTWKATYNASIEDVWHGRDSDNYERHQPDQYSAGSTCDPFMEKNGKTTCEIKRYRCDEAEPDRNPKDSHRVSRYGTDFTKIGWLGHGQHPNQAKMHKQSELDKAIKSNYFKGNDDGTVDIKSSRTNPMKNYPQLSDGDWKIDDTWEGIHGRHIEQLRHFDPHELTLSEADYTNPSHGNPDGRRDDAHRYADWIKQGHKMPPISVVETPEGKFKVSNGHRRTAAAKIAGTKVPAWVSHTVESPDTPGHATGLTDRIAKSRYSIQSFDLTAAIKEQLQA